MSTRGFFRWAPQRTLTTALSLPRCRFSWCTALIELVSFDVWNTLLRLEAMFEAVSRGVSEVLDIEIDVAKRALLESYAEAKRLRKLGVLDGPSVVEKSQTMYAQRLSTSIDAIRRGIARALLYIDPQSILFPDTIEALESLATRGLKMAIVGNTLFWPSSYTRFILEKLGIGKYFAIQLYADEIGISKPDRRIFVELCKTLRVEPEHGLHVGDGIVEDIGGALSTGMKAALIRRDTNRISIVKELGLAIIPSLKDLVNVLDELS